MKKKTLILSLLFASTLGLASCVGNKPSSTTSDNQTSDTTTSQGELEVPDGYELINSVLDVSLECETKKMTEDFVKGPFTIVSGTEVRARTKSWIDPKNSSNKKDFTKSIKIGGTNDALKVKANGKGYLDIYVQNGSSGVSTRTVTFAKTGGPTIEVKIPGNDVSPDLPDYAAGSPTVKVTISVEEGAEYTINRDSGTIDIYYAELTVVAEKAELTGFGISSVGTVEFVEGQSYDASKIRLEEVYGNGRRDPIDATSSDISIDSSAVNMNVPGVYNVSVKYKDFAAQNIEVTVYKLDDITLGFNKIIKGANSAAGNSTYVNNTVKQVFASGSTFNYNNLTVTANCSHPTDETKKANFIMNDHYTVTCADFDSSKDGSYDAVATLSLNGKDVSKSYKVHVVTTAPSEVEGKVQVKVDQAYQGVIGAVANGYNQFTTIQQALDYLANLGSSYNAKEKVLSIAAGTYKEKLEINLPKMTIIGENKDTTIIEWDSLYGLKDEGGFEHTTDSTQTVSVRDAASDCTIKGLTISNWFNSEAHFDERLGAGYSEHRALALLVQSDHFVMDGCKLLGYQDTVEFFTGRQLIKNTYIEGTTDFIFGSNNTTYFYNCEIHSIANAKGNGGYITAFKGCNKGASDSITYGAIFDSCNFTADASIVSLKKTSIGRCWGAYAAVMVMNSTMAGHITKAPSTGNTKDERYVSMNGNPTDPTAQFTEYNNTGDGALTEAVAGMKLLSADEAKNYNDFAVIFGTKNGNLSYSSAWEVTL